MAILQAYQAEVLKEMDEGDVVTPEAIKELRRATNLALCATKHTARAVGRSLATAERHLWLNLTDIREKEKAFLLDRQISSSGLFGDAVNAVVDKFRAPKLVSPLIHFTSLPCRDLPGVSAWILRTIQFGYTLQFARNLIMMYCMWTAPVKAAKG